MLFNKILATLSAASVAARAVEPQHEADSSEKSVVARASGLQEGEVFANAAGYLGWVVIIGSAWWYNWQQSSWRMPDATTISGGINAEFLVNQVIDTMTSAPNSQTDIENHAMGGGWTLTVQAYQGYRINQVPTALLRNIMYGAIAGARSGNGFFFNLLDSHDQEIYRFQVQPTNTVGLQPGQSHEEL
ncbi:hypothetical protein NQ176_g1775 [Zarea fungicola]|uniref:Uncharacterized protein n=1 Tax=Zarea fungicola TaxID=93591 RepID=A0ACC1NRC3_9HYPO|nr:hypothetical protein NQ176_g1775 [Lecanicillium fungicola]